MKRYYIHKLGCPKNDVDAECISGYLRNLGYQKTDTADDAELLIVNTCGFIQDAKEESIDAIMKSLKIKRKNEKSRVIVTGCLAQRYANDLAGDIPEIDGILGLDNIIQIQDILESKDAKIAVSENNLRKYREFDIERELDANQVFAYLKISDGCDNRCAYCSIPDIRGRFRSRQMENILDEARYLLDHSKKEIILVSQESTAYGLDLYGKQSLIALLDRLSALNGEFWIRIMYLHPGRLTSELIDYMIDNPRICNYFDLPLQHCNDEILQAMGRKTTRSAIEKLIGEIRGKSARSAIRTNFIVGFPGETGMQFKELCSFVEEIEFDRLGAFVYSREENTKAANMPEQVKRIIREKRYHRLMEIQREIAFTLNEKDVGERFEVIVDRVNIEEGYSMARTRLDAPEIDREVKLGFTDLRPGEFIPININGYDGYDLLGTRE
ncbi:MAG: 30S ribosomal protein S12 methylthiotransferase RimO [candidate division Zixibacteria bacterium]